MTDDQFSYGQRANPAFDAALMGRTAREDAAFFLPYLRTGMRVLDVGCGPGSITVGIAQVIGPGEVVGIDRQSSQIDKGRALAAERGVANVSFELADLYSLPFPHASFDAVFANGVLMHLREPVRALAEVHRVLRPGGVAGVRDPDAGAMLRAPTTPLLEEWRALALRVHEHNGGNPHVGRHHRKFLLEAGFLRAEATASLWTAGSAEGLRRHAPFLKASMAGLARTALEQGWTDQATVDAVAADFDRWAERPDAFYAATWCEAVGWI